jgi:preprotein translocase subunit SecE
MKTTHKKKKKKGTRKSNRHKKETEINSISAPSIAINDGDNKPKSRQVISRTMQDKRTKNENILSEYVGIAFQFLKDSRTELKKVKWPTRKELLASTAMVIFLTIVMAFFLGLIDFGLMNIIQKIVG